MGRKEGYKMTVRSIHSKVHVVSSVDNAVSNRLCFNGNNLVISSVTQHCSESTRVRGCLPDRSLGV